MYYYFAYGSNMNSEQMKKRCPSAALLGTAVLHDYALAFTIYSAKRESGCADIVESAGSTVHGLLYRLTKEDMRALDEYEGHPMHYRRTQISVVTDTHEHVRAESYEVVRKQTGLSPSKEYLKLLIDASIEHTFPQEYVHHLKETRTQE